MSEAYKIERTGDWSSQDILFSIERIPGSEQLFVGSSDFQVYSFDASQEKPERRAFVGEGHTSYVTGMARIGNTLVTGSYDGSLVWWDHLEGTPLRKISAHDRWIRRIVATPDQQRIVSVADDMQCKVWDAQTGDLIKSFTDHATLTPHHYPSMLYAVAVSDDGELIATGDRVGHVAIWDSETFEKLGEVETPGMYTWDPKARRHSIGGIRSLAFSPDGTQLAVGGIGKIGNIDHLGGPSRLEVFEWDSEKEPILIENEEKKGLIEQINWRADGNTLFGFGGDHKGFVNLYDLAETKIIAQAESSGHIHAAVVDESGSKLYTSGHNRINRFEVVQEDKVEALPAS